MRFIRDIIESHQQVAAAKQAPPLESVDVNTSSSGAGPEFDVQDSSLELSQETGASAAQDLPCSIQEDHESGVDWDLTDKPQNTDYSDETGAQSAPEDRSVEELEVTSFDPLTHQNASEISDEMAHPDVWGSDKTTSRRRLHTITPQLEERLATQIAGTVVDTEDREHASLDVEPVPAGSENSHVQTETGNALHRPTPEPTRDAAPFLDEQDDMARSHREAAEEPALVDETHIDEHQPPAMVEELETHRERTDSVSFPQAGRERGRSSRAKTRLLGFNIGPIATDPMSRLSEVDMPQEEVRFPVGWLVIVDGPGRGHSFQLSAGVAKIGRGEDQDIRIDFGDSSISRENHAAIAYDMEQNAFFIGHGGKSNIVRRNNRPVLSTEELAAQDMIRVGETTLRFVPLCGGDFSWDASQHVREPRAGLG
ncbi:FHA domain-containing protein [Marimonas sp. MJW-29]|uniref:FHA domain-containing protein n=1 Tax=Sulfitobacter sediminis TaxID=3234186 RepID=A0ABV3RTS5_9RHOB